MANRTVMASGAKPAGPQSAAPSSGSAAATAESRASPASKPNSLLASSLMPVTPERRQTMVAEAAYYIAEQRGFGEGHELEDWLLAEKQIDATLST